MKRIDISNREHLTLFNIAFMNGLFSHCRLGDLYTENNRFNEIQNLYISNEFYSVLMKDISDPEKQNKIYRSNAAYEWNSLIHTIKNFVDIEDVDYGKLDIFTSFSDLNYSTIDIPEDRVLKVLSSPPLPENINNRETYDYLRADLNRIYIGIDLVLSRFQNEGKCMIYIRIPYKSEISQRFPLKPLLKLLNKYNQNMVDISFFKGIDSEHFELTIEVVKNPD